MSFQDSLNDLQKEQPKHMFRARKISDCEGVLLGLDSEDNVCVFIKALERSFSPSIKTDKLQIDFSKEYLLYINQDQSEKGIFHSIQCLSKDREEIKLFTRVMDSVLSDSSMKITIDSLNTTFFSLVNLFKIKPSQEFKKERQGLWGELFFMKNNGGFLKWAEKWHTESNRTFDFSVDNIRVDIKSTIRPERIHDFSHKQLFPIASDQIAIVSFILHEDDGGKSLKSLIEEAIASLRGTPYYLRLERAVMEVAMNGSDEGPRYNEAEATKNMAWFYVKNIPRFKSPEPEGVSGTRYRSDLTNTPRMTNEEIESLLISLKMVSKT